MGGSSEGVPAPEGVVSPDNANAGSGQTPERWEEEELGQNAYERRLTEMIDLPKAKIIVVNLNLTEAIAAGLGVLPRVQSFREALLKALLDCRFQWVDGLEDYTLALNFARAAYLTVTRPTRCAPELWLEARHVRRVLMNDWRTLAARGLLDQSLLRGVQRGKGYLEMGTDLTVLSHVHRAYAASSGAPLLPEVERASVLARAVLTAGGRPDPKSEAVVNARDLQNRAFSLFSRAYNETRFSIAYLRRDEGDIDRIIPSLYSRRRGGASSKRARVSKASAADSNARRSVATPTDTAEKAASDSTAQPFEDEPSPTSLRGARKNLVN